MHPKLQRGSYLPDLGIAAAAFTAFLSILTISDPPALAVKAVEHFSIGIPLLIACFFLPEIKKNAALQYFILWLSSGLVVFGNLSCLLGIHNCFKIVSPIAGNHFKQIGIFIFLLSLSGSAYELIEATIVRIKSKRVQ